MKLHRIEVTNINSLYGDQVVDLDGALAGASLFLIQGPTGSGKSTLMDAISLALFGTTPRLMAIKAAKAIAEQVMSRGTGVARAAVEFSKFEGGSRVRYRAAWRVHRANRKPDGTMQDVNRSLERLGSDGTWTTITSDKRDKVHGPHFDAVLEGFSARDFQRSMLLAQGNFDAMLKAKPEERAAILEGLTNTEDYLRLGRRAADLNRAWSERLKDLESEVKGVATVTPEELEDADARAQSATAAIAARDAALLRLGAWRAWLQQDVALAERTRIASASRARLDQDRAGAAADLTRLAEHERCANAFEAERMAGEARATHARLEAERAALAQRLPALLQSAERAENVSHRASDALEAVAAATEAMDAPLRETESAEAKANTAKLAAATRDEEATAAEDAAEKLEGELATARALEAEAAVTATTAQVKRDRHAGTTTLRDALPGLQTQHAALTERRRSTTEQADAIQKEQTELEADQTALAADTADHARDTGPAIAAAESAAASAQTAREQALGDQPAPQVRARLRTAREAASHQRERVARSLERVRAVDAAARIRDERSSALHDQKVVHDDAIAAEQSQTGALDAARQTVALTEAAVAPLRRILALREERESLSQGDPCPLCGSETHPFHEDPTARGEAAAIDQTAAEAETRHQEAQKQRNAAQEALSKAQAERARQAADLAGAVQRLEEAQTSLDAAEDAARQACLAAGLPETSPTASVEDALEAATQDATAARDLETEADTLLEAEARAMADLEATRQSATAQAAELDRRRSALDARTQALATRRKALADASREQEQTAADLAASLESHRLPTTDLDEAVAQAAARVATLDAADEALRAAREAEARATDAATATATRAADHREAARTARETAILAAKERDRTLSAARAARADLERAWSTAAALDGEGSPPRPAASSASAVLREDQRRRLAAARTIATGAEASARSARGEHTRIHDLATSRAQDVERAATSQTEAERNRDAAIKELGIASVTALMACWIEDEKRQELVSIREDLRSRTSAVEATETELAAQRTSHDSGRPEDLPADATDTDLAEKETVEQHERATAQATLTDAEAVRKQAETGRQALAAAQASLEAARQQSDVWRRLHQLIGSGDGKAFRLFAQALNLDQLLQAANVHLLRLNERYRLRVKRDENNLPTLIFHVDDTWRPGQPRSLKTLSGGESFLVSLALALGLSDLRTQDMPVETLLLDEGFGTLDRATLDIAMAALQQLQASGRQIGIISHVVGLQDAIPSKILVEPQGEGRSRVRVPEPA